MKKLILILPLLILCGCLSEFITENREIIGEGLGATAALTGGVPILKWIFLTLVGGGVAKGVHNSIKEKK